MGEVECDNSDLVHDQLVIFVTGPSEGGVGSRVGRGACCQ